MSAPHPLPTTVSRRHATALLVGGAALSGLGMVVQPRATSAPKAPDIDLETMIPKQFGTWQMRQVKARPVNPQTEELLSKLYSQLLERVYVNAEGREVMLAMAYGADQRGGLESHKPEVCYPAQGFQIKQDLPATIQTSHGNIVGKQLFAVAEHRPEPITYWFTMSNEQVLNRWQKRWVELKSAMTGSIPDGLLVRASSIDADPQRGWVLHQQFIEALVSSLTPEARKRVAGLAG